MIEQLVLFRHEGASVLNVHQNTGNHSPFSFANPEKGWTVPRLGSQDLVRFAYEASKYGLQIVRFRFGDSRATRLDSSEEGNFSEQLLSSLDKSGIREALDLLETDLRDYTVIGVELFDHDHDKTVLSRYGVIDGTRSDVIIDLLNELWDPLVLA